MPKLAAYVCDAISWDAIYHKICASSSFEALQTITNNGVSRRYQSMTASTFESVSLKKSFQTTLTLIPTRPWGQESFKETFLSVAKCPNGPEAAENQMAESFSMSMSGVLDCSASWPATHRMSALFYSL